MGFPFKALTFDCFGTLMDWRRGQRLALEALPEWQQAKDRSEEGFRRLDAARMKAEQALEAGPYLPYGELLARSLATAGETAGLRFSPSSLQHYAAAMATWPAFADSREGLAVLRHHGVGIGLLSNCEQAVLAATAKDTLDCADALLISAEAVRSYKPAAAHWQAFLEGSGLAAAEVLHVSAYAHYDLYPAQALGFPIAFLERDGEPLPPDLKVVARATTVPELIRQLA